MCETKLIPDIKDSEFLPKGYISVSRKDRTRAGGGVLIATKSTIVAEEVALEGINGEVASLRKGHDSLKFDPEVHNLSNSNTKDLLLNAEIKTKYLCCFYFTFIFILEI